MKNKLQEYILDCTERSVPIHIAYVRYLKYKIESDKAKRKAHRDMVRGNLK